MVTTATVGPDEGSITGARSRVRWRPASKAGGSWPRGATDAVRRGLVSAAILWELLWFGSQSFLWPTEQSTPLASLSIVLVLVSVLVLLGSHLVGSGRLVPGASLLNVVVLVVATVAVGVSQFSLTTPDWNPVTEIAALTAGIAGLLLAFRWAAIFAPMLTLLVAWAVLTPHDGGESPTVTEVILDPVYVGVIGVSTIFAARALMRNAVTADSTARGLLDAEQSRLTAESVEHSLQQTESLLHERVLNTLIAIGRGGLDLSGEWGERLRARCADSASLLGSLYSLPERGPVDDGADLGAALADITEDLRAAGVVVTLHCDDMGALPAHVRSAVRSAAVEALTNVARHAQASNVHVTCSVREGSTGPALDLRITDDGQGFDSAVPSSRMGIATGIMRPIADVGGEAQVSSSVGSGATVRVMWREPEATTARPVSSLTPAALTVPILSALTVLVVMDVGVNWVGIERPIINALALAVWILLVAAVVLWSRHGRLSWLLVVSTALGGWLVYALQGAASGETTGWSSQAVSGMFLVVAAAGPRWGWLVLVAVWLVFQGDPLHELTQPGTAMILVGALLGRSLRRNAEQAWRNQQAASQELTSAEAARARVGRHQRRFRALRLSRAQTLFTEISRDVSRAVRMDARDVAIREERFIRNVMVCDPDRSQVEALASRMAEWAHQHGVLLDLDLRQDAAIEIRADVAEDLMAALAQASPTVMVDGVVVGTTPRLSVRTEGGEVAMRLLVPIHEVDARPRRPLPTRDDASPYDVVCAQVLDESDAGGVLWLYEVLVAKQSVERGQAVQT